MAPAGGARDAPRTSRPRQPGRRQHVAFTGWPAAHVRPSGACCRRSAWLTEATTHQATAWGRCSCQLWSNRSGRKCALLGRQFHTWISAFPCICRCHHVDTPGAIVVPHATWLLTKLSLCSERALACDTLSECGVTRSSRQPHVAKYHRHLCLTETLCRWLWALASTLLPTPRLTTSPSHRQLAGERLGYGRTFWGWRADHRRQFML